MFIHKCIRKTRKCALIPCFYIVFGNSCKHVLLYYRIKSAVGVRTIHTTTQYGSDIFFKRFYPYSSETGLFEVVGYN